MLKLIPFDTEYDSKLLEASYKAIKQKEYLQIVTNQTEQTEIHNKTAFAFTIPDGAAFTFQNLFKLTLPSGQFYIAQCLFDFGYPVSHKLVQSSVHKYYFQAVGIATLKTDLGNTLLRRETKTDKILGSFFSKDFDIDGAEKFNDKYYLVTTNRNAIQKAFDKTFTSVLAKYDNVILISKGKEMYITFESEMENNHTAIIEDILSNSQFLSTDNIM